MDFKSRKIVLFLLCHFPCAFLQYKARGLANVIFITTNGAMKKRSVRGGVYGGGSPEGSGAVSVLKMKVADQSLGAGSNAITRQK